MSFEIVGIDVKHDGWARFLAARVRLPDGTLVNREIEDHGRAAAVLAFDPERRTAILVRQFRAPVFYASRQDHMLEVIAGIEDDTDADAAATAKREAMEEAGLRLESLQLVATAWTMPGISTERMTLYLAAYGREDRIHQGGGIAAAHENTVVEEIALARLAEMMKAGEIADMKTLVLIQALMLRKPDLFT
jgi:nudix-type nucleoside diphosphatase (YffH/AdpP family)